MESDGTDFELPVKKTAAKTKATKVAADPKAKVSTDDCFSFVSTSSKDLLLPADRKLL